MARRKRSSDWGARHPRIVLSISSVILAVVILVSIVYLRSGSYQGATWWLCGGAGIVAGIAIVSVIVRIDRRPGPASRPVQVAVSLLSVATVAALRFGLPSGQYHGASEFFNLLRAVLIGYGIVHWAMMEVFIVRAIPRARPRPRVLIGKTAPGSAEMKVRFRCTGTDPAGVGRPESGAWQRGRLIAASGTVSWVPRKDGAPVDLTGASLAPDTLPPGARRIPSRTTTLMTAQGPAELEVTPMVVAELFPSPELR